MLRTFCRFFATETKERRVPLLQRVLHIRKVARVNSGGKIRSTSALVVVGDMNGRGGFGMGRGSDTATAVQKALAQAQKNMEEIPRLENRTIHADMNFKFKKVELRMRNAKPGHGVVANNHVHEICRCVGISDLTCKVYGSQNPLNIIQGTFAALKSQKTAEEIARMRGKKVMDVQAHYYGIGQEK